MDTATCGSVAWACERSPAENMPGGLSRVRRTRRRVRPQGSWPLPVWLRPVIDEAVCQRRAVSLYCCSGPRRFDKPRAGNGNTDLIPGSDSYLLPCGHQIDRSCPCCRPAPRPFAETSCPWAPASSPPTSRNGGKPRAAGIARRALCSPTLFAAAPAVILHAAVSLSGERGCAGDPIAART